MDENKLSFTKGASINRTLMFRVVNYYFWKIRNKNLYSLRENHEIEINFREKKIISF